MRKTSKSKSRKTPHAKHRKTQKTGKLEKSKSKNRKAAPCAKRRKTRKTRKNTKRLTSKKVEQGFFLLLSYIVTCWSHFSRVSTLHFFLFARFSFFLRKTKAKDSKSRKPKTNSVSTVWFWIFLSCFLVFLFFSPPKMCTDKKIPNVTSNSLSDNLCRHLDPQTHGAYADGSKGVFRNATWS